MRLPNWKKSGGRAPSQGPKRLLYRWKKSLGNFDWHWQSSRRNTPDPSGDSFHSRTGFMGKNSTEAWLGRHGNQHLDDVDQFFHFKRLHHVDHRSQIVPRLVVLRSPPGSQKYDRHILKPRIAFDHEA